MQRKHRKQHNSDRVRESSKRYMRSRRRIRMKEDTACVPSKTAYMEDGLDANGIYYFGKKPEAPIHWRDYDKMDKKLSDYEEDYRPSRVKSRTDKRRADFMRDKRESYRNRRNNFRRLRESMADKYGLIQTLDELNAGMINNVSDDDLDDIIRYFNKICTALGCGRRYESVYVFSSSDDGVNPIMEKRAFNLRPLYRDNRYNAFIGEINGERFIVDDCDGYCSFSIYARSEDVINAVLIEMDNLYD